MITGPLLGFIAVILAYILGILISIKYCRAVEGEDEQSTVQDHTRIVNSGGLDIFIIPRSEEYTAYTIPRPTLIEHQYLRNQYESSALGPAPAYEEPPSYEDCVRNCLV